MSRLVTGDVTAGADNAVGDTKRERVASATPDTSLRHTALDVRDHAPGTGRAQFSQQIIDYL